MKKLALIVAAMALPLPGCAAMLPAALETVVSLATPAKAVGDKVVVEGTRGLILAHNAAQAGIALVNPLVRARVLTAAQVDRYEQIIDKVEEYGVAGRSTLDAAERTARLFNLADELNRMAGK